MIVKEDMNNLFKECRFLVLLIFSESVVSLVTKMTETLQLRGTLRGHNGWVTQITTNPKYPDMILSSSRDKSLIVWKLNRDEAGNYGVPQKRLHGHGLVFKAFQ